MGNQAAKKTWGFCSLKHLTENEARSKVFRDVTHAANEFVQNKNIFCLCNNIEFYLLFNES